MFTFMCRKIFYIIIYFEPSVNFKEDNFYKKINICCMLDILQIKVKNGQWPIRNSEILTLDKFVSV